MKTLPLALNSVWARKRRLVRTCIAVTIGVAFLAGTLVLGDTLTHNFQRLFTDVSAGTDVVVRNATVIDRGGPPDLDRGLVDASLVDTVRAVPGVATVEPQVVGYGSLLGKDGDAIGGNGPPRLAGSWITTPGLNPYRLVEGRAPKADDEVVINRGAAKTGHLHVGDTTTVQTPEPVHVRIVGISTFGDTDGLGDTTWAAFTLHGAQANVTHQGDELSTVLVKAAPGVSGDVLPARIAKTLPDGAEAITGHALAQERIDAVSNSFLGMLKTFLLVFALIALFVAALTIANSFAITLAQRTRELALLRAVGATRRQVRRVVTVEALLVGVASAAVGVVAGLGVAGLLKGMFDAFGGSLPAGGLTITARAVAIAMTAGIVVTVVAAQLPSRHASRVPAVAALRDDVVHAARHGRRARVVAGLVLLVAGGAGALTAASSSVLALAGPAALALVVATLLLAPWIVVPAAGVLGRALAIVRGPNARLAEQNARRDPRRSAATATALVVGVAVVTLFTVFAASMKTGLDGKVTSGFRADLAVNTAVFGGSRLSPRLTTELRDLPEVERAVPVGGGEALVNGHTGDVIATQPSALRSVLDLDVVAGNLDAVDAHGLAISNSRADDKGWHLGTTVPVTFADGATERLTVRAIYDSTPLLRGVGVVDEGLWAAHTTQPTDRTVFVTFAPRVSPDAGRRAVTPLAVRYGGDVQDATEFAGAVTNGLDLLLGIVYVLLAIAVLIALVGIANTLSLAVHERRHEIGLLRAVGQTRRQTRSVLRLEAVIVAVVGSVIGLALGTVLGWMLFAAVADVPGFTLPMARLVVIAVLGGIAGALAARRPARHAARLPVLDAIATP